MNKQQRYDQKCQFYSFRFNKKYDRKYIEFLDRQKNKTDFLRECIDREVAYGNK